MEIISNRKRFVVSDYAPENTNVYWVTMTEGGNIEDVKEFINGKWDSILVK